MYGLIVLVGFIIYCLLCFGFVRVIASLPPQGQRGKRKIYGLVAFILFNTPLGYQFVPATVVGTYGCFTEAGFELYKTPEQWRTENPGAAETLERIRGDNQKEYQIAEGHRRRIFHLNDRFDWVIDMPREAKNLVRSVETVVDTANGEVMARRIDYVQQGIGWLGAGSGSGCFRKSERERWLVDGHGFSFNLKKFGTLWR